MSSFDIVDPVCPKSYTLQNDRTRYRLCKCIKNKKVTSLKKLGITNLNNINKTMQRIKIH